MIDVLVVDDHPAVRAGLVALLRRELGIVPVGAAPSPEAAMAAVERTRPDVAIVDYDLDEGDGLTLCYDLSSAPDGPRVVIYSAFASAGLRLAARAAGAAAVLDKSCPPDELFSTIREVAAGRAVAPASFDMSPATNRLDAVDRPILAMLLEGEQPQEVAGVLGMSARELDGRIRGILARLAAPVDASV